jgi:hypothetical protein
LDERVDANLLWMAGFFDGEGYVGLQLCRDKGRNLHYVKLKVSVTNTDLHSLAPFRATFHGTTVRSWQGRATSKVVYRWDLSGKRAYDFLMTIAPHLITKKEQVDLAIKFWELPWRGRPRTIMKHGGLQRSDEQQAVDIEMARVMRAMKRA